jgi:hypothetical protein
MLREYCAAFVQSSTWPVGLQTLKVNFRLPRAHTVCIIFMHSEPRHSATTAVCVRASCQDTHFLCAKFWWVNFCPLWPCWFIQSHLSLCFPLLVKRLLVLLCSNISFVVLQILSSVRSTRKLGNRLLGPTDSRDRFSSLSGKNSLSNGKDASFAVVRFVHWCVIMCFCFILAIAWMQILMNLRSLHAERKRSVVQSWLSEPPGGS